MHSTVSCIEGRYGVPYNKAALLNQDSVRSIERYTVFARLKRPLRLILPNPASSHIVVHYISFGFIIIPKFSSQKENIARIGTIFLL